MVYCYSASRLSTEYEPALQAISVRHYIPPVVQNSDTHLTACVRVSLPAVVKVVGAWVAELPPCFLAPGLMFSLSTRNEA